MQWAGGTLPFLQTLTCMLWHVRLATVLATGPHVTLCARHARVLHMYIEKEYMKVMRETVSGGGSRYFAGSRYFMIPGPKLVHAIQHQIFKEKKKKFARPHQFPTMVARESRIFLVSPYVHWFPLSGQTSIEVRLIVMLKYHTSVDTIHCVEHAYQGFNIQVF